MVLVKNIVESKSYTNLLILQVVHKMSLVMLLEVNDSLSKVKVGEVFQFSV